MTFELNAILKSCARTSGGLKTLVLIDPADLATQPSWHLVPNVDSLTFQAGKAAYAFQHRRFTARLEDDTNSESAGGDFFTYRLSAFIRVVRAEVELLRAKLINRRIHVLATYMNGDQRFLPFVRLTGKGDSGAAYGKDAPGVAFTGVCRLPKPAPFLGADVNVIGGPFVPPALVEPADVHMIDVTITASGYNYTIPAGYWLVGWELTGDGAFAGSSQTVTLQTAGGYVLGGPITLTDSETWVGQANMLPTTTAIKIQFSGLVGTNQIRLWLLG